jgi:hypothetical protein
LSADGTTFTLNCSENVQLGANGISGLTISPSGGAATLTYSSGSGTSALVCTASRTILSSETITRSYTNPGDGIKDTASTPNQMANFSAQSVTNNSTQAGALLFQDTMDSGYTATVDWASFVSQSQSHGWHYIDGTDGRNSIEADPLDGSRLCYALWYYNDGNGHCRQWKTDPNHTQATTRPTEIYFAWDEYRPSDFDFGPSKDWRIIIMPSGWWSDVHDHDADTVDVYGGCGGPQGGTSSPCDGGGINIQGAGATQPGDPNTIFLTSGEILTRGVWHTIEIRIKTNTPNNADGAAQMWIDSALIGGRTDVKFTQDGVARGLIDGVRMGMEATNGGSGAAFNPQRKRSTRNFRISASRIT